MDRPVNGAVRKIALFDSAAKPRDKERDSVRWLRSDTDSSTVHFDCLHCLFAILLKCFYIISLCHLTLGIPVPSLFCLNRDAKPITISATGLIRLLLMDADRWMDGWIDFCRTGAASLCLVVPVTHSVMDAAGHWPGRRVGGWWAIG